MPDLPRAAWKVLAGDVVTSAGTGLTLPFLVVYLHRVRGIGLEPAVLALSALALAGFAGNPLSGALTDRIGARNTLFGGLVLSALGAAGLALVSTAAQGLIAAVGVGLGAAVIWPAQDTLLASVVATEQRSPAFSLRYATMNAALGLGALCAAALVNVHSPASFVLIYALDAGSFLAFIPFLLRLPAAPQQTRPVDVEAVEAPRPGYRSVVRDRVFVRVWLLTALLVTIGYSQLDSALPIFATRRGGSRPVSWRWHSPRTR